MFLIGGPAFAGTTLLTHLLNHDPLVCLDEPDFHDPAQSHRGIPLLQQMFPERPFPERPPGELTYEKAVDLIEQCQQVVAPARLGFKTANWMFIAYAEIYKRRSYPVIAIVRDIRDALAASTLPPWVGGEDGLNKRYRLIWDHLPLFDLWLRYEDLVQDPVAALARIGRVLGRELVVRERWEPTSVPETMLKLERHELLRSGSISRDRVGLWKTSGRTFSRTTRQTAKRMGY